jgi:hypothetical protein
LLEADILSYIGSINTAIQKFNDGENSFKNSLRKIDEIKGKNKIITADRSIEIASFSLSNDLRNITTINNFLQNNGIEEYDEKFTSLLNIAETKFKRFSYVQYAGGEIVEFFRKNYTPSASYYTEYMQIAQNMSELLYINHFIKINKAIGKYYAIRGCYDFIVLKLSNGQKSQLIPEIEKQLMGGLNYLIKSKYKTNSVEIENYLSTEKYDEEFQKDAARNFTILYGLGFYIENSEKMKKYLTLLAMVYSKEHEYSEKIFINSVMVSIEDILKPFDIKIDGNDFIDKIQSESKQIENKEDKVSKYFPVLVKEQERSNKEQRIIEKQVVLFLASDPTDAARLRLGEEFRKINEKIRLSNYRENFKLELPQFSARPEDITQALLDSRPKIVHFSGHGTKEGELCFETQIGTSLPVGSDALSALFKQFSNIVNCVILNACYSEIQAEAIIKHINYVIGMSDTISDEAAIAFATGFYQALGAGESIEKSYQLGCTQIQLQGISDSLEPVLHKKTV